MQPSSSSSASAPSPFRRAHLHARDQAAEIPVALLAMRRGPAAATWRSAAGQSAVIALSRSAYCRLPRCLDRQLGADDGAQAGLLRRLVEARRAVDAVGVEQRQRRIAERRRALDERFGQRGALEKAERGGGVEFDVHGRSGRSVDSEQSRTCDDRLSATTANSVHDALEEPGVRVALAEHAIGRAVAQRHVPFVAIPRCPSLPASRRTCAPCRPSTTRPTCATGRRTSRRARRSSPRRSVDDAHRPSPARHARARGRACGTGAAPRREHAYRTGHGGTETRSHSVLAASCLRVSWSVVIARRARTASSRTRPGCQESTAHRRAAAALAHQRGQARHQRGQLLGRRQRARQQRELDDARRRRDRPPRPRDRWRRPADATRDRAAPACAACARRASAPAAAASARAPPASRGAGARAAPRRRDRAARDAPTAAPAAGRARTTAARALRSATRDRAPARTAPPAPPARSGRGSSPRASRCQRDAVLPEPRRHVVGRQRREIAQRAQPPAAEGRAADRSDRSDRSGRSDRLGRRRARSQQRRAAAARAPPLRSPGSTTVMPGAMAHEQARRRARAGNGDAHAQAAVGGRAAQLRRQSSAHRRTAAPGRSDRARPRARRTPRCAARTRAPPSTSVARRALGRVQRAEHTRHPSLRRATESRETRRHECRFKTRRASVTPWLVSVTVAAIALPHPPAAAARRRAPSTSRPARRRLRSAAPVHAARPASDSVSAAGAARQRLRRHSTHAVSLPSIVRCTRSQVVNGRRFSAEQRHVGQIDRHDAEPAGLQHEIERLERAIDRCARRSRAAPATRDRLRRGSTAGDRDRRRRRPPTPRRGDRRCRRAPRSRRAAWPRPAAAAAASCGPTTAGRQSPTAARAAARRAGRHRARATSRRRRAPPDPSRSSDGSAVVSVRSSLRARSADSSDCQCADSPYFRLEGENIAKHRCERSKSRSNRVVAPQPFPCRIPTPPPATGFRRLAAALTYRDFRVLWIGAFTSTIGTWMQKVAQSWLVLTIAGSSSAFYLGLDTFLGEAPILLFTLIGGVVADRRDRRQLLLMSQYVQMATAFTLAALVYWDVVRIWHVLALSVVTGTGAGVRRPGVPVADAVARRQGAPAERDRAQLDPVQPGARDRPAARRRARWPRSAWWRASASTACRFSP